MFVLSAKSIPLPSMECLWFGNDFLASSACLYLRPQTHISEVSYKLKVCSSVLQPSANTGVFVSRYLCHFSKYLQNENINSSMWAQRFTKQSLIFGTKTYKGKQATQQYCSLPLIGTIPFRATYQRRIPFPSAPPAVSTTKLGFKFLNSPRARNDHATQTPSWSSLTGFPSVLNIAFTLD